MIIIALLNEKQFMDLFNDKWCWRVVRMVHLSKDGTARDYPAVLAGLEVGRAGEGEFSRVTRESEVPWGDYLYLQSVARGNADKIAYTRFFIDITQDMVYEARPHRALISTEREVVSFYPAGKEEADEFLNQAETPRLLDKLCEMVGKDRGEVNLTH